MSYKLRLQMIVFLGIILFIPRTAFSQLEWRRNNFIYNMPQSPMVCDHAGNVYVVGLDNLCTGHGEFLAKYSTDGVLEWQHDSLSSVSCITIDQYANIYLGGTYFNGYDQDEMVCMFDSSGVRHWTRYYNGNWNLSDGVVAVCVDGSGNVITTSINSDSMGVGYYYNTVKRNSSGVFLWASIYCTAPPFINICFDAPVAVSTDQSGNIYVTGNSEDMMSGGNDIATIKYSPAGVQQWVQRYAGPSGSHSSEATAMAVNSSGDVVVTGCTLNQNNDYDYVTLMYDMNGVLQWQRLYNGNPSSEDKATAVIFDPSGNVYVTGLSFDTPDNAYVPTTIKYNTAGTQQWITTCVQSATVEDDPFLIRWGYLGHLFISGTTYDPNRGKDFTTVKMDSGGNILCTELFNSAGNDDDIVRSLAIDDQENIYVSGTTGNDSTATIKYGSATGVNEMISTSGFSVYPNPSSGMIRVFGENFGNAPIHVVVYDISGKKADDVLFDPAVNSIMLDESRLPDGEYIIELSDGRQRMQSEKLIIRH